MYRTRRRMPVALAALVMSTAAAVAAERMGREISDIPGMPVGMTDVGQDATGYLWISSSEGLGRYDGFEIRPWGEVPGRLTFVSTGPTGGVVGGERRTGLYEVMGTDLVRLEAPPGTGDPGPQHAIHDRDGRLWAAWSGRVWRREGDAWLEVGPEGIAADYAFSLAPRSSGGVLVGSATGDVWIVDADDASRRVAQDLGGWIMQVHDHPDGPVATVRGGERPGFVRLGPDGIEPLLEWVGRSDGLARHGDAWWVAYSTGVWVLYDDGSREFLTPREGFAGFGNLATDREGGLWVAGVRGLSHYPRPETRIWTELTGLPHTYLRAVFPLPDGLVLTSWRGPLEFDGSGRAHAIDLDGSFTRDPGCLDPWGGLWVKGLPGFEGPYERNTEWVEEASLLEWRDGRARVRYEHPRWYPGDLACDVGPDGSFWMVAGRELFELPGPGREPELRGRMPPEWADTHLQTGMVVRRDGGGLVVTYFDAATCDAPLPGRGTTLAPGDWECRVFTAGSEILDIRETPSGRLWLAAADGGVYERIDGTWTRAAGKLGELHEAIGLEPSPAGGLWVIGWRDRWRFEEGRPGEPPRVVERLGAAHGVPDWQNGYGLYEQPDGTVWIPLFSGLVRVPASVRRDESRPPTVTLTRLVADGREVAPDESLELRHGGHALEIRWSALSFRDPTRIRYRMRLDGDAGWSELDQPFVRLAGLDSGRHRVELSASLDGNRWSERPAVVAFAVRPAWYLGPWFLTAALALVIAATWTAYRLRVAHLLRLERQRTRIAMDQHDELGAGLGSAGLLVGLLSDGDLGADERHGIAERAMEQIRGLGGSLSDIVWSLRPGTETLDALLLFLRQRAGDLFPPGAGTRVDIDAPDPCPALPLSLQQRRNLQWIAVEALHNASRHAEARRVVLRLRPDGDAWVLEVRDDGAGFDATDADGSGLGRESMRRRAGEIGATLEVRSRTGSGTSVSIRFRPGRRT